MARADGIVALDIRFNVGDIVYNVNGLAYEVQLDPARPMMGGHPGRATDGAKFRSLDSDKIVCRFTMASQATMLTAEEYRDRVEGASRSAAIDDGDLIPIF